MKQRAVLDLRDLPLHGMGSASVTWWGTLGFMLIEGSGFALVIGVYLYLESLAPEWPIGAPPARSRAGHVADAPAARSASCRTSSSSRWAARQELRKVQIGILVDVACSASRR